MRHARPLLHLVAPAAALSILLSCGANAPDRAAAAFLLDRRSAQHEQRWPCTLPGHRVRTAGLDYELARFPFAPDGVRHPGAYRGLSGAPVVDGDGVFIGAFGQVLLDGRNRDFGILPRSEFTRCWKLFDALPSPAAQAERDTVVRRGAGDRTEGTRLRRGDPVGAVSVFGDLVRGRFGRVADVRGSRAILFAHAIHEDDVGGCQYALMRTSVMGTVDDWGENRSVPQQGPIIGQVFFDSSRGAFARVGPAPRCSRVTLIVAGPRTHDTRLQRRFYVVERPDLAQLVADCIVQLLDENGVLCESATLSIDSSPPAHVPGTVRDGAFDCGFGPGTMLPLDDADLLTSLCELVAHWRKQNPDLHEIHVRVQRRTARESGASA